jgi:hypothetical protein
VNGFRKHARKAASCIRARSVSEKKALIAMTGTLPPASGPKARICYVKRLEEAAKKQKAAAQRDKQN